MQTEAIGTAYEKMTGFVKKVTEFADWNCYKPTFMVDFKIGMIAKNRKGNKEGKC